jgi:predicted lipoprotein with Yx(FWY)xxD motif
VASCSPAESARCGLQRPVDVRLGPLAKSNVSQPDYPEQHTVSIGRLIGATTLSRAVTKLIAADSNFGRILYDASGQAIYLFDAEESDHPECYGDCAKAWPPVLTKGRPRATDAVRSRLLGTTPRSDGSMQVSYAGHPLYFYAHEGKYQVLCHNVKEFGGTWLVVKPDGKPAGA